MAKKSKRPCCNCKACKCRCHKEKDGDNLLGRVQMSFYQFPDKTHDVKITFTRYDDLPDPKKDPRAFTMMGIMAAQVQDYAKKQLKAIDMLVVGKEEMKIMMEAQDQVTADVDRLQKKLPFEEEDK